MPADNTNRMVVVAQFAGTHGVRGEFKLRSFTEDPEALFSYGPLTSRDGGVLSPKKIREQKPGLFVCRDASIGSPEACEPFKGQELFIPRTKLPDTGDEDDFYVQDLIGLEARDEGGTLLGRVKAVPNYGAGDILEIKGDGPLLLVPFTKDAVPTVSLKSGFVTVIPPEDDAGPRD